MTRPLAEFILHNILFLLDQLRPYVHEDYVDEWTAGRKYVEMMTFIVLPRDDQFG